MNRSFEFEAVGLVSSRCQLATLEWEASDLRSANQLFTQVRAVLEPLGFTGVEGVMLSEDDGQSDSNIKVFVVVKLNGPDNLAAKLRGQLPGELTRGLDALATHVCGDASGIDRVGPEGWEFVNSEEFH
jgi:hypothetical protein